MNEDLVVGLIGATFIIGFLIWLPFAIVADDRNQTNCEQVRHGTYIRTKGSSYCVVGDVTRY